jgi:hypothetical protein
VERPGEDKTLLDEWINEVFYLADFGNRWFPNHFNIIPGRFLYIHHQVSEKSNAIICLVFNGQTALVGLYELFGVLDDGHTR